MIKNILFLFALTLTFNSFSQVVIYSEDFQSGLPASYTIVDNDGLTPNAAVSDFADAWIELVDPDNASDTIVGSTSYFDPIGQADRWIITDTVTLGAYGNIAYWETRSHDPSFPDSYYVLVSTTDTQLSSFTDTLDFVYAESNEWTSHSANLSELGLDNQTIRLAFVNRTDDGFKLYLDDISIEKEDPSGVNELDLVDITIYPNPSSNNIKITGIQNVKVVSIVSIFGMQVLSGNETTIDISALEPGNYFVRVEGEHSVARSSFIKL